MKREEEVERIVKVGEREPKTFGGGVTEEINKVKMPAMVELTVEDGRNFVFRVGVNKNRGRRGCSTARN